MLWPDNHPESQSACWGNECFCSSRGRTKMGAVSPRLASRPRCSRCNLSLHLCLCDEIPQVHTRTRILLLQHVMEIAKKSNTGGVAALEGAEVALPLARLAALRVQRIAECGTLY